MSAPTLRRIVSLHIYPVKSCRGVSVSQMTLGPSGPEWDRQWMLVDERGLFQTQRQLPKMAEIECDIGAIKREAEGHLGLSFGGGHFAIPPVSGEAGLERLVKIWKTEMKAAVAPDPDVHQALSEFLGRPVWLVQFAPGAHREVVKKERPFGAGVKFADGAPLLITNRASLEAFNERLSSPVGMERFRPNVVVEGGEAWEEDRWQSLESNSGLKLDMAWGCGRCQIINQDQRTGHSPSNEPLLELAKFRKTANGVEFGVNAVHRLNGSEGLLKVGEELRVVMGPLL